MVIVYSARPVLGGSVLVRVQGIIYRIFTALSRRMNSSTWHPRLRRCHGRDKFCDV